VFGVDRLLPVIQEFIKFEFHIAGQFGVRTILFVLGLLVAVLLIKRKFK
jgi:hypothetical protein